MNLRIVDEIDMNNWIYQYKNVFAAESYFLNGNIIIFLHLNFEMLSGGI